MRRRCCPVPAPRLVAVSLTPVFLAVSSIGTEHEKFGFRNSDKRPMDYQEIKHLLEGLVRRCVQPRGTPFRAHNSAAGC